MESTPATIARFFARKILRYVGIDNFVEIQRRNRSEENPGICHSHDFCDANVFMASAHRAAGVAPDENGMYRQYWDEAWQIAVERYLS